MSVEKPIRYLLPGEGLEKVMKQAYWNILYQEMREKKYDTLLNNITDLREMIKKLIPSREDLHTEIDEYIDIPFLKQKFECNIFNSDEFIGLFSYITDWVIRLGSQEEEKEVEIFKTAVIKTVKEKGYLYILPYAFDALHKQVHKYVHITEALREKLNLNNVKQKV